MPRGGPGTIRCSRAVPAPHVTRAPADLTAGGTLQDTQARARSPTPGNTASKVPNGKQMPWFQPFAQNPPDKEKHERQQGDTRVEGRR